MLSVTKELSVRYNLYCTSSLVLLNVELVWLGHNYTTGYIDTASACVNAGVSLEDGNLYNIFNVFDHIGEAVAAVSNTVEVM